MPTRGTSSNAVSVCPATLGCEVDDDGWQRFLESAQPLAWVRASHARALAFRNQAVVALAAELGREVPVNSGLLRRYAEIRVTSGDGH